MKVGSRIKDFMKFSNSPERIRYRSEGPEMGMLKTHESPTPIRIGGNVSLIGPKTSGRNLSEKIGGHSTTEGNLTSRSVDRKFNPRFIQSENSFEEKKGENRRIRYEAQLSPSQRGELKPLSKCLELKGVHSENKRNSSDHANSKLKRSKDLL